MELKKLTSFKHFLYLFLAIFLCFSLTRNILRMFSTQSRLDNAKNRLSDLKMEKASLMKDLQKMESPLYVEAQIRNKLGLAKENEIILVFPEDDLVRRLSSRTSSSSFYDLPDPNWKIWLDLFL